MELRDQLALAIKVDSTLARAVSMHRKINAILEKEKDKLPSAIAGSAVPKVIVSAKANMEETSKFFLIATSLVNFNCVGT